jgi:signal transduction histidine kinase
MPRIFERFFRLDEVKGHLFRGAGLGLSIARQVIEQHQGKIEVQSVLGEGSTFTVWLPVKS